MTALQFRTAGQVASRAVRRIVMYAVALFVLAAGLSALLSEVLTYAPFTFRYYEVVPNTVCPGQETGVNFGREISKPQLGDVRRFEVFSQWVNADTGKALGVESFPETFTGQYGYVEEQSDFVRFAPNEPGRWFLRVIVHVHGTQALHQNLQITEPFDSEPVRVLPFSADRCEAF